MPNRIGLLLLLLLLSACQQAAVRTGEQVTEPTVKAEPAPPPSLWERLPQQSAATCEPPEDLWVRLRDGFALPDHNHKRIKSELAWYARHQGYLDRVVERAEPYLYLVTEAVEERGIPSEIALLPIVESAYQPFAYSHGRAAGLWQFVPGTGRRFKLKQDWWYDGRRDVAESTRAALDYLEYLHRTFGGDWLLALAAYNSGEGTVMKAIRYNRKRGRPTDFWNLNLPNETRGYVPKLLAISTLFDTPEAHGVTLQAIDNRPFLTAVEVDSQIDLDLAAELAGIDLEEIYWYNPGYNRWATAPGGPHKLLLPISQVDRFMQNLERYPREQRITWKRHRIKSGESLGVIADRYATTIPLLKKVNKFRGNTIRAGDTLIVPVARKSLHRYRLSADQRLKRIKSVQRSGNKVTYKVREGDTLWDIARKYGVGVQSLAKWNGMAPRDPLHPGQKLVIWTKKGSEQLSELNPADFVHPYAETTRRRIGYTVRSGDSLARIAQRFRVSINSLKRWNKLDGERYLQPGQRLTMYVDVTRQSGRI